MPSRDAGEKYIKRAAFLPREDEILIELVNKHPPLYDVRLQSYKDNIVSDNIWEEIGKALNKTSKYYCIFIATVYSTSVTLL